MFVVMGGTGHVGSAVAETLLDRGEEVTIISHDPARAEKWRDKGARIAEADANDPVSLRSALRLGRRAFLLNPPADPMTDTDAVERSTVASMLEALDGADLEKVVAESTAGAREGERIGDLSVLWEFEEGLRAQSTPAAINRAAYYMSNWDAQLATVRETGKLSSFYPADMALPMVAQRDLGLAAAERLLSPPSDAGVRYIEGPTWYSARDVARAFAAALGREVDVELTPRDEFRDALRKLSFSEAAADSFARMTEVSLDRGFDHAEEPIRGATTLSAYVSALVAREPT